MQAEIPRRAFDQVGQGRLPWAGSAPERRASRRSRSVTSLSVAPPALAPRAREMLARSRSPMPNQSAPRSASTVKAAANVSSARPPAALLVRKCRERVHHCVEVGAQCSPQCSKSSPVLTTTVSEAGAARREPAPEARPADPAGKRDPLRRGSVATCWLRCRQAARIDPVPQRPHKRVAGSSVGRREAAQSTTWRLSSA